MAPVVVAVKMALGLAGLGHEEERANLPLLLWRFSVHRIETAHTTSIPALTRHRCKSQTLMKLSWIAKGIAAWSPSFAGGFLIARAILDITRYALGIFRVASRELL